MTELALSVNGAPATHAILHMPLVGQWTATVRMSAVKDVTGDVKLRVGTQTWLGGVTSSGSAGGVTELHIIGGPKLLAQCSARYYSACKRILPAAELVSEAGHQLAPGSSLPGSLSGWVRRSAAIAEALSVCAPSWRVLRDGSVFVGDDTWTVVTPKPDAVQITGADPTVRRISVAMVEPVIAPGVTWLGRKVVHVDLEVTPDECRGHVYYAAS